MKENFMIKLILIYFYLPSYFNSGYVTRQSFHKLGYFDPDKMCVVYILTQYPDVEKLWKSWLYLPALSASNQPCQADINRQNLFDILDNIKCDLGKHLWLWLLRKRWPRCVTVPRGGRDQEPASKELLVRSFLCLFLPVLFLFVFFYVRFVLFSSVCFGLSLSVPKRRKRSRVFLKGARRQIFCWFVLFVCLSV